MTILLLLIFFTAHHTFAQDTCSRNETRHYDELSIPITEYYHENGLVSHRYIKRKDKLKVLEWNSCGQLIRKTISTKTMQKVSYSRHFAFDYYPNGKLKTKRFTKMTGCLRIKRSRRKDYFENGKVMRK